jgi:hypothetical protein
MPSYSNFISRVIPEVEFHQNRYARELDSLVHSGCRWLDIVPGAGYTTGGAERPTKNSRGVRVCYLAVIWRWTISVPTVF